MRNAHSMTEEIQQLRRQWDQEIQALRAKYVGKNGAIEPLIKGMAELTPEDRNIIGGRLNELVEHIKDLDPIY